MGNKHQALSSDGQGGFQWRNMNALDHVYVVGSGSIFETINDALSVARMHQEPVLIKGRAGVYNEKVVTRFKTCIEGAGQDITIIRFHGANKVHRPVQLLLATAMLNLRDFDNYQ
jgi:hypothetical protein